jgi:hypothetical protein
MITSVSDRPSSEARAIEQLYYGRHRLTFRVGTYLALVRMMGIGHLVTALYGHAQLVSDTYARLARTRQTVRDLICEGLDSEAGRNAVQRLRAVHRNLPANAEDFRYVLATFFLEPLRWNACHARVKLAQSEIALLLSFWTQVGQAMDIPNLPAALPQWQSLQRDYEARHMTFTREGHRLASMSLREVVKLTLPLGTRALFRQLMLSTIEPSVRAKLGLVPPVWYARIAARLLARAMG